MTKDINDIPQTITAKCFFCKQIYNLFDIQKMPINFCRGCCNSPKLIELTTLFVVIQSMVKFAEEQNKKNNDRLVVDVSDLLEHLQK